MNRLRKKNPASSPLPVPANDNFCLRLSVNRLNSHVTPLGSFTEGYLGETSQQTSQSVTNGSVTASTAWGYDTNTNDRRLISITNSGVTRSYTLDLAVSWVVQRNLQLDIGTNIGLNIATPDVLSYFGISQRF